MSFKEMSPKTKFKFLLATAVIVILVVPAVYMVTVGSWRACKTLEKEGKDYCYRHPGVEGCHIY